MTTRLQIILGALIVFELLSRVFSQGVITTTVTSTWTAVLEPITYTQWTVVTAADPFGEITTFSQGIISRTQPYVTFTNTRTITSTLSLLPASTTTSTSFLPMSTCRTTPIWSKLGCYIDTVHAHSLQVLIGFSGSMTIENCQKACQAQGHTLSGVDWEGVCYCDTDLKSSGSRVTGGDLLCNLNCDGNKIRICEGKDQFEMYMLMEICVSATSGTSITTASTAPFGNSTTGYAAPKQETTSNGAVIAYAVVGSLVGLTLLCLGISGCWLCCRKRRTKIGIPDRQQGVEGAELETLRSPFGLPFHLHLQPLRNTRWSLMQLAGARPFPSENSGGPIDHLSRGSTVRADPSSGTRTGTWGSTTTQVMSRTGDPWVEESTYETSPARGNYSQGHNRRQSTPALNSPSWNEAIAHLNSLHQENSEASHSVTKTQPESTKVVNCSALSPALSGEPCTGTNNSTPSALLPLVENEEVSEEDQARRINHSHTLALLEGRAPESRFSAGFYSKVFGTGRL